MWTRSRRPSYFILLRIKKGRRGFTIPVFLPVFEITLNAVSDLAFLLEKIFFRNKSGLSPKAVIYTFREMLSNIRCMGKWTLLEVKTDDIEISIRLI